MISLTDIQRLGDYIHIDGVETDLTRARQIRDRLTELLEEPHPVDQMAEDYRLREEGCPEDCTQRKGRFCLLSTNHCTRRAEDFYTPSSRKG
jgi:hypothetical protein